RGGDEDGEESGESSPGSADEDDEAAGDEQGAGGAGDQDEDDQDGDDTAAGSEEGEGEDEDAEADPLAGLDKLDQDVGEDEPTQEPVKSKGRKGTEPLPIGGDLDGMAEDATDQDTQDELERLSRGMKSIKEQMKKPVEMQ